MARIKKEFSKEAMYKKIMPSMLRGTEENNENTNSVNNISIANTISTANNTNFAIEVNDRIDNNNNSVEDFEDKNIDIDEDKETFYSSSETKTCDINYDNEKITVNFVEILVRDKLDNVLEKFKCCKCLSCKNDIVAIALNNLPVYYFSGNKAEIEEALSEFKNSNNIDIVSEIIKAIISIRKKEKH